MLWYIAIIAAINLGLGYLWGAYLRPCPRCAKARAMGLSLLDPSSIETEPRFEPEPETVAAAPPRLVAPAAPPVAAAEAMAAPLDPATGLVTREYAEKMLTELSAADAGQSPLTVALVEMAPIDWIGQKPDQLIDNRLLCGVSNVVRQSLAAEHTLARFNDQQFLVLVPHEGVQQATRRAEELRQRVATTEFVADGQSFQTTVTCALAEVSDQRTGPKLFEFLQEALDEAKRYGGNRTFMHDGKSPTPVVPAELTVAAQQLAI
jgi:diguanylate cyclase (GGDEF)-like protein